MNQLTYAFNRKSAVPLYKQLYEHIKKDIQQGSIKAGSKLPPKRRLATHLRISQNTVESAYSQLIEEGYIYAKERKGYYVKNINWLQKIHVTSKKTFKLDLDTPKKPMYDLSYQGVEHESFPFEQWRKLSRDVVNENDYDLTSPGDLQGFIGLRRAIADYLYQSRGVYCSEDQIIISSSVIYLYQSLIMLLDKDTVYGIESPGYEKLDIMFDSARAKYQPIPIDENGMIPKSVKKSDADVLCITPSHQFPSGGIMSVNRRSQLLHWANQKPERYLIEDDYDSEFKYNTRPIPALQGMDHNKVIYLGSFSKSLSPAIRISYMVLPEKLLMQYRERLYYLTCPVPTFQQKALYSFLSQGYFERHLNKMRGIYSRKREILVDALTALNRDIEILGTNAGLHLIVEINNSLSEQQLVEKALENDVGVQGVSEYYSHWVESAPPTLLLGYASIKKEDIALAVARLDKAWFK